MSKMTKDNTPSENIDKDQDNLMSTLESIRSLLAQNESKLSAARESISIANTNTKHDSSALLHMRSGTADEEIVPILDDIVEPDILSDNHENIPELDSFLGSPEEYNTDEIQPREVQPEDIQLEEINMDIQIQDTNENANEQLKTEQAVKSNTLKNKPDLTSLTAKNRLMDSLDELQLDLEESLRQTLMRAMVTLEKDLKERIRNKVKEIKAEIDK